MDSERQIARKVCGELQSTGSAKLWLPKVIKLMASTDLGVKRIAYSSFAKHHHRLPNESLLAVNTLMVDSTHSSPLVRSLVLNTIPYLKSPSFNGISQRIITDGLKDTNTTVRRHAVIAQNLCKDRLDELYEMDLVNSDPVIVGYNLLFAQSDPTKISAEDLLQLVSSMDNLTSNTIHQVLTTLKSFTPSDEAQLPVIINSVDPFLQSDKVEIVTAALDVFLHFTQLVEQKKLVTDLFTTIIKSCLPYLRSDIMTSYCMFLWLQENMKLLSSSKEVTAILLENYHLFLHSVGDPSYLLSIKLDLLKQFVNNGNIDLILDNIRSALLATRIDKPTTEHLLLFLSSIKPTSPSKCLQVVEELLLSQFEVIQVTLLRYLHHFMDYSYDKLEEYTFKVLTKWRQLSEMELLALLNLCIHFAHKQSGSLEYMQQILTHVTGKTYNSLHVKCLLGKTLVSCFKHQPAEYSSMLKLYLAKFHQCDNVLLNEHVSNCIADLRSSLKST